MAFLVSDLQVRTNAIRVGKNLTRFDEYPQVWFYIASSRARLTLAIEETFVDSARLCCPPGELRPRTSSARRSS
jgi:hypothetical protein